MASLNALVEAAKLVEYDRNGTPKQIFSYPSKSLSEITGHHTEKLLSNGLMLKKTEDEEQNCRAKPGGARETHNKLEKNRRAELKNYFLKLKDNLPRLCDCPKASNVSILTEAIRHIAELTATDKEYESERQRLKKCRICYEERIKMLKEDLHRQNLQKQLFVQVQHEKKIASSSPTTSSTKVKKEMKTVEIQANEHEINEQMLNAHTKLKRENLLVPPDTISVSDKSSSVDKSTFTDTENSLKSEDSPAFSTRNSATSIEISTAITCPFHPFRDDKNITNNHLEKVGVKRHRSEDADSGDELKLIVDEV